jgi:dipeptidyl aminopeptidase/acylaminoacyl peptidase
MADPTQPTTGSLGSDPTVAADDAEAGSQHVSVRSIPARLGRYEVLGVIGRGGMGAVYAALDPELGRKVAIKVLHAAVAAAARDAARREAQALARLVHANVVAVHDVGDADGVPFVVMQLVDGTSIGQWAHDTGASPAAIVAAFRHAGRGLAAAHAAGLVHRDVKPGNILVDRDGMVRVGDFGLARAADDAPGTGVDAAASLTAAGTPAYMAPEQLAGKPSPASDQYGLAISLWEVLVGTRPTAGDRARPPRMPAYVHRALVRALADDPAARFPSMTALVDALAPPRHWGWLAAAAAAAAAVVAVGVAVVHRSPAEPTPPAPRFVRVPALHAAAPPAAPAVAALTHDGSGACAYAPAITADGTVVFDRTAGDAVDLYAVALAGGSARQLTDAPTWEWRANRGRRAGEVTYLVSDPATDQPPVIAALDVATGKGGIVVRPGALDVIDALAVGDAIYYTRPHELRRVVAGDDRHVLDGPAGVELRFLAASSDGGRLAAVGGVHTDGWGLCWIDAAAARVDGCTTDDVDEGRPAFGRDGAVIYYNGSGGIHRRDLATGRIDVVAPGVDATGGIAVAPDGVTLVASTCRSHGRLETIADAAPVAIPADDTASAPSVADDGAIAYAVRRGGVAVAVVRAPDGSTRELTELPMSVHDVQIAPDGSHVAYVVDRPTPGLEVRGVDQRTDAHRLTDTTADENPRWLDATHLAFDRPDTANHFDVYTVGLDGSAPRLVQRGPLVYAVRRHHVLVGAFDAVYWLDPDTGRQVVAPVPHQASGAAVSPDGRWLAYQLGNGGDDLWKLDLDDLHAQPQHLITYPHGVTIDDIAIDDAGRVIVAPRVWWGDLVVVKLPADTAP